jgi:hypothetical protein
MKGTQFDEVIAPIFYEKFGYSKSEGSCLMQK